MTNSHTYIYRHIFKNDWLQHAHTYAIYEARLYLTRVCLDYLWNRNSDSNKGEGGLRVDWSVRGFWEHQREALFDCRIFNADAISYENTPINTLLEKHRNAKKQQYNEAVEDRRGTFTPFIATCDGILDVEAEHYIKRLEQESKFAFLDQ